MGLINQLRAEVLGCSKSETELATELDIPHSLLIGFTNGSDVPLGIAEKLADYLGLTLCRTRKPAYRRRSKIRTRPDRGYDRPLTEWWLDMHLLGRARPGTRCARLGLAHRRWQIGKAH